MCVWLELIPRQGPTTGTSWGQGRGSWSGGGRVTPRHSTRQPPSSRFNYQRFPRFSSSRASACSLLPALLELLCAPAERKCHRSPVPVTEGRAALDVVTHPGPRMAPGQELLRHCQLSLPTSDGSWWLQAPISIPLAALILPVLLLSWHPKPLGTSAVTGTVAQPAWDQSVSPSLTVIRSSKFHHRCAQALMASQAASNFNLPFLSPKSHSPS